MNNHTPGPWKVGYNDGSGLPEEKSFSDQVYFCITDGEQAILHASITRENPADAYLIAAAPELLASLTDFVKYLGDGETPSERALLRKALRAIQKAKGG